ncbi:MAG: hypothetical protein AAGN82_16970 [Myxococcota bacterium]
MQPYRDDFTVIRERLRSRRDALEARALRLETRAGSELIDRWHRLRTRLDRLPATRSEVASFERDLDAFASSVDAVPPFAPPRRAWLALAASLLAVGLPLLLAVSGAAARHDHWRARCPQTEACAARGACAPRWDRLWSRDAAAVCRPDGDAGCRTAEICRTEGRCYHANGRCEARRDDDCRAATFCREYDGRCAAERGRCIPQPLP